MIDQLGPAIRFPEFFGPGRSRMKNDEFVAGLRRLQELLRLFHGGVRQVEPDGAGGIVNSQRLQQAEVVIDRVKRGAPAIPQTRCSSGRESSCGGLGGPR